MLTPKRLFAFLRSSPPQDAYTRAIVVLEGGHCAEALDLLNAALHTATNDGERAQILNKRGVALVGLARKDAALADFIEALECVPSFVPTVVNIGNLLLEDNAVEEAIEHYAAALRTDETYAYAHRNLAVAYRRAGKRAEAVRSLRAAMRYETRAWRLPWEREGTPKMR